MIRDGKCCSNMVKKYFNKELIMTTKDFVNFENFRKCRICDNAYVDADIKVRDHCHITGKSGGLPHRGCNIMG